MAQLDLGIAGPILPDTNSVGAGNVVVSLANYLDPALVKMPPSVLPVQSEMKAVCTPKASVEARGKPKSKAKKAKKAKKGKKGKKGNGAKYGAKGGGGVGKQASVGSDSDVLVGLKCVNGFKHCKGGRKSDPACDSMRRKIYVPVYPDGPFMGMWKIDPMGDAVTRQTTKLYEAFCHLIDEKDSIKLYVDAPLVGCPWFPCKIDGVITGYLKTITISDHLHSMLWKHVMSDRANIANKQAAINKIVIPLGFSQEALGEVGGRGLVRFTFKSNRFMDQARALFKYGVGGGGTSKHRGRALLVAVPAPAAGLPA